MTTIWHNPRCSKSRETLALLEARGIARTIRLYRQDPPAEAELRDALARLALPARDLIRRKHASFRDAGLSAGSDAAAPIAANPVLIERPVVFHGDRAALGSKPNQTIESQ